MGGHGVRVPSTTVARVLERPSRGQPSHSGITVLRVRNGLALVSLSAHSDAFALAAPGAPPAVAAGRLKSLASCDPGRGLSRSVRKSR